MDNAVLQQWTRNRVLSPTPSAVATRRRNHHRRVDHLHSTFHYTNSLLSQCCVLCADVNGDNVVGQWDRLAVTSSYHVSSTSILISSAFSVFIRFTSFRTYQFSSRLSFSTFLPFITPHSLSPGSGCKHTFSQILLTVDCWCPLGCFYYWTGTGFIMPIWYFYASAAYARAATEAVCFCLVCRGFWPSRRLSRFLSVPCQKYVFRFARILNAFWWNLPQVMTTINRLNYYMLDEIETGKR